MNVGLRARLSDRFVARLCPDQINVVRATYTKDGRGGQTLDWNIIGTYKARMVNRSDDEQVLGDAIRSTAKWDCLLSIHADVQANDRVEVVGDSTRYWDVVGTDVGQTDLLIQRLGLEERTK